MSAAASAGRPGANAPSSSPAAPEADARCEHTRLTKPECHCSACLREQIARHSNRT